MWELDESEECKFLTDKLEIEWKNAIKKFLFFLILKKIFLKNFLIQFLLRYLKLKFYILKRNNTVFKIIEKQIFKKYIYFN